MDDGSLQDCIQLLVRADSHLGSDPSDLVHAARLSQVIEGLCEKYGVDCPALDPLDGARAVDRSADSIGSIDAPGTGTA